MRGVVIFDMDQTLVHSARVVPAWQMTCAPLGLTAEQADAVFYANAGTPLHALLELAGARGGQVDELAEVFWAQMDDGNPEPVAGAEVVLERLRAAGFRLYLSTGSRPQAVDAVLDATGWRPLFAQAIGSTPEHPKGAAHYAQIAADCGLGMAALGRCGASIGDGLADMRHGAAHDLALRVGVLYQPDRPGPQALRDAGATHLACDLHAAGELVLGRLG